MADEIIADDEAQDVAVAFAVEWGEMLERIREQQERHRQPEFVLYNNTKSTTSTVH